MDRSEVAELSYITPIANAASIQALGLLSHNRVRRVRHTSIANESVNDLRSRKRVPGGLALHDYVNLYFNARNPMMYVRREMHADCCVIRVSPDVLDLDAVIVTDQNAARLATFRTVAEGLPRVDREITFARYWLHDDPIEQDRRKAAQCAEVLVPHAVPLQYLIGAYVSCASAQSVLRGVGFELDVRRNPYIFFR
jgi:ssDNA thymidine ADP-ribosyltransferase DarT-like protein